MAFHVPLFQGSLHSTTAEFWQNYIQSWTCSISALRSKPVCYTEGKSASTATGTASVSFQVCRTLAWVLTSVCQQGNLGQTWAH